MNLQQLTYFNLACQFKNHREAARTIGCPSSSFSENISRLETDLNLQLFRRGPSGHYPTDVAATLYQRIDPLLQFAEIAQKSGISDVQKLHLKTPLKLVFGRLSTAIGIASQRLRESFPAIIVETLYDQDVRSLIIPHSDNLIIEYGDRSDKAEQDILYHDVWCAIVNFHHNDRQDMSLSPELMKNHRIFIPDLSPAQKQMVRQYCKVHCLAEPVVMAGAFEQFHDLARLDQPFILLAPETRITESINRLDLRSLALREPLSSPVIIRYNRDIVLHRHYVALLKTVLAQTGPKLLYRSDMTFKQMDYFSAVYETRNISSAARKLHVSQPAISSQLKKMETLLGKKLFTRTHKLMLPDDSSTALYKIFSQIHAIRNALKSNVHNALGLNETSLTIGIIPLLNHANDLVDKFANAIVEIRQAYPSLRLEIVEAPAGLLLDWVNTGSIRLGIVEAQVAATSQIGLDNKDRLVVLSKRQDKLLPHGDVALSALLETPLVLPNQAYGFRRLLDDAAERIGQNLNPQFEVNSLAAIIALVGRMKVATVMPETALHSLDIRTQYQTNPIVDPVIYRSLSVIFSTNRSLSVTERMIITLLRNNLAHMPSKT
ncbi:LysR family transcriptional regulator [Bartonella sp. LJL80]